MPAHNTEHTVGIFDITPYTDGTAVVPIDPVSKLPMIQLTLPLNHGEEWHARILPMLTTTTDDQRAWSFVREGQFVRVPLMPYRLPHDLTGAIVGIMEVTQCLVEAWPNAIRTHLVVGTPLQELSAEGVENYRIWIGFAARTV